MEPQLVGHSPLVFFFQPQQRAPPPLQEGRVHDVGGTLRLVPDPEGSVDRQSAPAEHPAPIPDRRDQLR
ncbi:hypothetical protein GCM10027062_28840 [Nocardioides hungaricus]